MVANGLAKHNWD